MKTVFLLAIFACLWLAGAGQGLNEISPSENWVEIAHQGDQPLDLSGWAISDDPQDPYKWVLENVTIEPMGFLVVYPDFGIAEGEILTLSNPWTLNDEVTLPLELHDGHTFAKSGDWGPWNISDVPTPETSNENAVWGGYASSPSFLTSGGLYSGEASVSVVSGSNEVRFTTDGSFPTINSEIYVSEIWVDTTTVVSVRGFGGEGLLPSKVVSQTFLIDEEMAGLPVVSISINPEYLFSDSLGMFVFGPTDYENQVPYFGANFWEDWEYPAQIQYFDSVGIPHWGGPIDLKIHGGYSRMYPRKGMQFHCDGWEVEAPFVGKSFNYSDLVLRTGGTGAYENFLFKDALCNRLFAGTNALVVEYKPCEVYINGEYWGIYEIREPIDGSYFQTNFGEKADAHIEYHSDEGLTGDSAEFLEMYNYVLSRNPFSEDFLQEIGLAIDLDSYVDWYLAQIHLARWDLSPPPFLGAWVSNVEAFRSHGKWFFVFKDMDHCLNAGVDENYFGEVMDESLYLTDNLFYHLWQNQEFRFRIGSRYADMLNTSFLPNVVEDVGYPMWAEIEYAFPRHCQRWNGNCEAAEIIFEERMNWLDLRRPASIEIIEDQFFVERIEIILDVNDEEAGRVQISTITPETYPWLGTYFKGIPITITAIPNVGYKFSHWEPNGIFPVDFSPNQFTLNGEEFDGDTETFVAVFQEVVDFDSYYLQVSEFYPEENWIELHNTSGVELNLSGFVLRDDDDGFFHRYHFPLNTRIPEEGYLVVVKDTAEFAEDHPEVENFIGGFEFGFDNVQDQIRIIGGPTQVTNDEGYVLRIDFDSENWPPVCQTCSYEFEGGDAYYNSADNWFAGCPGGSPGVPYDPGCGVWIEEQETKVSVVYPNPAQEILFFIGYEISIFDLTGKLVLKESGKSIDIAHLESGLYLAQVDGFLPTKIVVE